MRGLRWDSRSTAREDGSVIFSKIRCRGICAFCRMRNSFPAAVPADLPADTLWVFGDMSDFSRAGEFLPEIAHENMLNIDHHLGNSRFGFRNYILEKEASTGTCVLRILKAMKIPVTPDIATYILTTIMTDTGAFMHTNTTADVLRHVGGV